MSETQTNENEFLEAKKLLEFLLQPNYIEIYNLSPREKSVVKMKWTYRLPDVQIAEKLGVKETRIKEIKNRVLHHIFYRIRNLEENIFETASLKKEIEKLKKEKNDLKKKFDALNTEDKEKFESLDMVVKKVTEVGFSEKTQRALSWSNIHTVKGLLQYRLSSLLLMKEFNISIVEEIEKFARKYRLKIKT